MINYSYLITKEFGIHARPAVLLAKNANQFNCCIMIGRAEQMADAKDVMAIMSLMLKQGDKLYVTFEGTDEELASQSMINLINKNL